MAAAGQGTATIDFGAWPGSNEASAVITGVADIAAGASAEAWPMAEASGSHTAADAAWAARFYSLTCGAVAAGEGFTIHARSEHKLQGTFAARYVWANPE